MTRPKLKLLQPRIPMVDTTRGIKMAPPLRLTKRTGRDADPRRTLPLNSAAWQRLRASVLAGEPLCRHCAARGLTVPATDVDHMNGADDNRLESLQPLCHECHSRKTAADQGKNVHQGCDVHGVPLDPRHPWNEGATGRVAALLRPCAASRAREDSEITSG